MTRIEEEGALVKSVYCESYKFYLKYHGREMDERTWMEMTEDFKVIVKNHHGAPICGRIMLATFARLERESR